MIGVVDLRGSKTYPLPDRPTAAMEVPALLHPAVHIPLGSSTSSKYTADDPVDSEATLNTDRGVCVDATSTR